MHLLHTYEFVLYICAALITHYKPESVAREQKDSILILFLIEAISFKAFILLKPFCGRLIQVEGQSSPGLPPYQSCQKESLKRSFTQIAGKVQAMIRHCLTSPLILSTDIA